MSTDRDLIHPRDAIMRTMERIYRYRMTTTSGGNISIRDDDDSIWITPARLDKGNLRRDDIVRVRSDGTTDGPHRPSSEFPFHKAVYDAAARPPRHRARPPGRARRVQHLPEGARHAAPLPGAAHLRRGRLRPLCTPRQRGAGPEHRGDLRRGSRLRRAREPRRRDRRRRACKVPSSGSRRSSSRPRR